MSKHLDFLYQSVDPASILVRAEGFGLAVALTREELIIAKAGILRRWGKLERFSLTSLVGLRVVPNPSANLLQLKFSQGESSRVLTVMYPPESAAAFERLVGFLQGRLDEAQSGETHGRKP